MKNSNYYVEEIIVELRKSTKLAYQPDDFVLVKFRILILQSAIQPEIKITLLKIRGGDLEEVAFIIEYLILITYMSGTVDGFQLVPPVINPSPHLAWLYGNQRPYHPFSYGKGAGLKSITVIGATQNAGLEKKQPSPGSYNYTDVMRELDKQSNKKIIDIPIAGETYHIKNPDRLNADELQFKLAEEVYDSIRECDTDICDIAANLGFKADNVKDHIFYKEHNLDRYGPNEMEHKRFDGTLPQALAWKRLEAGIHLRNYGNGQKS